MATIGIIDADLLANRQRRFPNLAAMKISAWHKSLGDITALLPSYKYINDFNLLYTCCVFTETASTVPKRLLKLPHVRYGGTGFFFDKAEPLLPEIEHCRPDYSLYQLQLKGAEAFYYTNSSIGFLTRGCFRQCKFCVNRNSKKVVLGSPLIEFYDPKRERVCVLDDNLLGHKSHYKLLKELVSVCERDDNCFEIKQGIDIRILRPLTAELLGSPSHFGEIIFAFDSIEDAASVRRGMSVLRKALPTKNGKAYVLCGFERQDYIDIATIFRRLEILWGYRYLGYLMRHEDYKKASPTCRRLYDPLAAWINQPQFQRTMSFRKFCGIAKGKRLRSLQGFERNYPDVASRFFNSTYEQQPKAF